MEALGTCFSQHGFKPRLGWSLLSGFNQCKPPSRTVAIAVDISKAFDAVSHLFLIEMIHCSRLPQLGQMACGVPPRQEDVVPLPPAPLAFPPGAGGGPTGVRHLPSPLHFVSDCPIPDLNNTSYADDFTQLVSAGFLEAEARANQLCTILVRWADGKQLAIAPQKSTVTLFTSETQQSRLHPQVQIGDAVAPLNRTPKILGVTLDTHFTFGPHTRDCVERASKALNITKALAWSSWGFTTETLVATYKAIVCPILNYAALIWFTQISSSHLDKLEVIQNKALRIATGCHQKAVASHLRAETGVLPLRAHL